MYAQLQLVSNNVVFANQKFNYLIHLRRFVCVIDRNFWAIPYVSLNLSFLISA